MDDLLDVSRVRQGKIELRRDVIGILHAAIEASRRLIDAHRHTLDAMIGSLPVHVYRDSARLPQVVANRLNNAARYQNEGGRIEVRVASEVDGVAMSVRVRGIGVIPDMLTDVFERFAQGERARNPAQGALGIGRSLVKRVVDLHDGSVLLTSEGLGHGAAFTVQLPALSRDQALAVSGNEELAVRAPVAGPSRRVLVVHHNLDAAEGLATLPRLNGHQVRVEHDGQKRLDRAALVTTSVVLLVFGMPGMDGYQVCRDVRARKIGDMQIIAMPEFGQERDWQRAHEAGFDSHTVQPLDHAMILHLVSLPDDA